MVGNVHSWSQALHGTDKEGYHSTRLHSSPLSPWSFVRVKTEACIEVLFIYGRSFRQGLIKSW